MVDLLIQSSDQIPQRTVIPDPKPRLIQKTVLASIRAICAVSDAACGSLNKHHKRNEFARKLIQIAREPNDLQLDALLAIGDLTASSEFAEQCFFVTNGLFTVLGQIL